MFFIRTCAHTHTHIFHMCMKVRNSAEETSHFLWHSRSITIPPASKVLYKQSCKFPQPFSSLSLTVIHGQRHDRSNSPILETLTLEEVLTWRCHSHLQSQVCPQAHWLWVQSSAPLHIATGSPKTHWSWSNAPESMEIWQEQFWISKQLLIHFRNMNHASRDKSGLSAIKDGRTGVLAPVGGVLAGAPTSIHLALAQCAHSSPLRDSELS